MRPHREPGVRVLMCLISGDRLDEGRPLPPIPGAGGETASAHWPAVIRLDEDTAIVLPLEGPLVSDADADKLEDLLDGLRYTLKMLKPNPAPTSTAQTLLRRYLRTLTGDARSGSTNTAAVARQLEHLVERREALLARAKTLVGVWEGVLDLDKLVEDWDIKTRAIAELLLEAVAVLICAHADRGIGVIECQGPNCRRLAVQSGRKTRKYCGDVCRSAYHNAQNRAP